MTGRLLVRRGALLGLLGATGLAAAGRFREAFALTLGASVAIVSALWLSDLVGRLQAPRPGAASRLDWKFGLKAVLRYLLVGLAVFLAVRTVPAEVPWLVAGLSTVVAAIAAEAVLANWREMRGRRKGSGASARV